MAEERTDIQSDERISVDLVSAGLSHDEAAAFVADASAGGICIFAGVTREVTDDLKTVELSYDAYDAMAVSTLRQIAVEVTERYEVAKVFIRHRRGVVPAGDASVLIAVSAPHRGAAFEGCRYVIDELKTRAPIWKKEHLTDGTSFWVEGEQPKAPEEPKPPKPFA